MDNLDYKLAWEKLKENVAKGLAEARRKDEIEAYNGGFGGNSMRYEDFQEMMDDAWEGRREGERAKALDKRIADTVSANEEDDRK